VRSYIFKKIPAEQREAYAQGRLPRPPKNYEPPRSLLSNPTFLLAHPQYALLAAEAHLPASQLSPKQVRLTIILYSHLEGQAFMSSACDAIMSGCERLGVPPWHGG